MRLLRVSKVKRHKIFRNFSWPFDLEPFGRFNLIYGWNGSGKTTLSSLLRQIETRSAITLGEAEFEFESGAVSGADLATAALPDVRVFNRETVASSFLATDKEIAPIYYFGEDSVEKQKEVERIRREIEKVQGDISRRRTRKNEADKALDKFCESKAREIKNLLVGSSSKEYNNYDRRSFTATVRSFTNESASAAILSNAEQNRVLSQKNASPRGAIQVPRISVPNFEELTIRAGALTTRSVIAQALPALAKKKALRAWLQAGLGLHEKQHSAAECLFCGGTIPAGRISELEAHFSAEVTDFQAEVKELAQLIERERTQLDPKSLPDPSLTHDHLRADLQRQVGEATQLLNDAVGYLGALHESLLRKHDAPFQPVPLTESLAGQSKPAKIALQRALDEVQQSIKKHNATNSNFERMIKDSCTALERSHAAEAFNEFQTLTKSSALAAVELDEIFNKPKQLTEEMKSIERQIVLHRRPAEELNTELRSYLGRDELSLDVRENGYALMRKDKSAGDLSEGEKTAIAFLYFLKSLSDTSFDPKTGIVVIDDPVSSLDASALFSAFGYMKERTQEVGQLFVLTHNFGFFSQVRSWFHHVPRRDRARFFMLSTQVVDGERTSSLRQLDPLLERYESEYHYLFKKVYWEANVPEGSTTLEELYAMPNIARRLLEAFLAFKYPDAPGNLRQRLERVDFDPSKKIQILRLLHTYSHLDGISEPGHDPNLLLATQPVLRSLLGLIEEVDPLHYAGMTRAVAPNRTET